MNSNVKALVIALVTSIFLVFIAIVVVLKFSGTHPVPEPTDEGIEVVKVETPVVAKKTEEQKPKLKEMTALPPAKAETLKVRVVEEGSKRLIASASILVQKATDGDRMGEVVYPGPKTRASRASGGEFTVELVPGSYQVIARAPRYKSKLERITIQKGVGESIELALSQGRSISGKVLTKESQPIGGAKVYAYKELGGPDDDVIEKLIRMIEIQQMTRETPVSAISAPDGTYQLDGLEELYYNVTALAEGYSPRSREHIHPTAEGINIILPEGSKFPGLVQDAGGAPVAEAQVSVYPHTDSSDIFKVIEIKSRPALETVKTDRSGQFTIQTLGSGLYSFIINASGFQQGRFTKIRIREGENPAQTFTLKPGQLLAGEVVGPEGETVAGARVRPMRSGEAGRNETPINITFDDGSVETDQNGRFEFNTLEPGKYTLIASHNDYAASQVKDVEMGNTSLKIALTRGGGIAGKVIEEGTRKPIAGARVSVTDMLDLKKEAVTDGEGSFLVSGLSNQQRGKKFVQVNADGYARISNASVYVEESKITSDQVFELKRTASVAGKVVNSAGSPVARARVMAKRKGANTPVPITVGNAITDENGGYSIQYLEAGDETFLSVGSSEYLEAQSSTFTISPGEHIDAEPIVMVLGGAIVGVVVSPEGRGVAEAVVSLRAEGETSFDATKSATTDSRGKFTLKGLAAGSFDLQAKSSQYLEAVAAGVQVQEGIPTQDVKIQLVRGQKIAGVVLDEEGKPIAGATILARETAQGLKEHRAESDAQGQFALSSLAGKEAVEIEASHPDYSSYSSAAVVPGTENLEVRLGRLGGVRGLVVDEGGKPVMAYAVQPTLQTSSESTSSRSQLPPKQVATADGTFEYKGIPAGTYTVYVRSPSYSAHAYREVAIRNGETVDLGKAVLQEGGVVDGFVVDAMTNKPIAGAQVKVVGGVSKFSTGSAGGGQAKSMVTTDPRGFFEFRNLRGGLITITASHPDYVQKRVGDLDANDASRSRNLQIAMEVGGEIFGTVVDASGNAKGGMNVFLTGAAELDGRSELNQRTASDNQGKFHFTGLTPGTYRVTAHQFGKENNPSVEFPLAARAKQEVELVVE
ncbi:MAG: carboxypeptidase regulatory-like domain-containing protein [Planctomycetes bacterium]|nr:carboxypeptidase regulatory-like domain-containing protein [Planctomycetota bacterium]